MSFFCSGTVIRITPHYERTFIVPKTLKTEENFKMKKITRDGYTNIVKAYQETGDQNLVQDMAIYLAVPLKQHTYNNLRRVSIFGYDYDDVYCLSLETLWTCMETYDGSKGADFLAMFTQRLRWLVNDRMIEKKGSLADDQYFNSISLDQQTEGDGTDTTDRDQFNILETGDFVCDDSSILKVEYFNVYSSLLTKYSETLEGVNDQMKQAILNDVEIIQLTMEAIENNMASNTELNTFLYEALPEVDQSTIRRRKKMAYQRFGNFLLENMG